MNTNSERTIGHFVAERELGRGGMGVVLLGRQPSLDRPVVLKKLRRDLAELPELAERFQREARAAAAIHHENVVAVYDCFTWRGEPYIAQEYVHGVDLAHVLGRVGALPPRIAGLIALGIARGLEEIHGHGAVHRDLKPANVLLGHAGEVKIADFGIVLAADGGALTRPGVVLGSPPYMPPEQLAGDRVDARGDLFSFGAVLYETLTGVPPFASTADDEEETLIERMQHERYVALRRRSPHTPRRLARLVRNCLRARPRHRPADARSVRRRLERLLDRPSPADTRAELARWLAERALARSGGATTERRVTTAPPRRATGLRGWVRRAGRGVAAAAAVAFLLLVAPRPASRLPSAAVRPARVRFAAAADVRVRIGNGPSRSVGEFPAVELPPGPHRLVFEDTRGDRVAKEIVLRPGENRVVSPRFGKR